MMTEQMYTTDTAAERLTRCVAEAVESGWRFSRAEFSVDDVATILEAAIQQPNRDAESVARLFHESYERLAPQFDYSTRVASAVPWDDVPADNKALMVATADAVLAALAVPATPIAPHSEQFEQAVKAGIDELRKVYTGGDDYWDEAADDARTILQAALPFLAPVPDVMRCEHDWIDGGCGASAPLGTAGWEQRTGPKGDSYWLCPKSVAEVTP